MTDAVLNKLAGEIAEVIQDYRSDEGVRITSSRVLRWSSQFGAENQLFILQEMKRIFDTRYISKAEAKQFLKAVVERLTKDYGYDTPQSFLANSVFLDLQEEGKSQKDLLKLLDEVIQSEYEVALSDCGKQSHENFVYIDDVLCTANTIFYDLKGWLEYGSSGETMLNKVSKDKSNIIFVFIFTHRLNMDKLSWRFHFANLSFPYKTYYVSQVDNDYRDVNSKLDFLMPIREGQSQEVLDYFARLNTGEYGVFREVGRPLTEEFFSSPDNRRRFENILLAKGLEILNSVSVQKENVRPLGFTLPSQKNFGFGTLCFTWRNIANNTPLVFWYSSPIWIPLFEKRASGITLVW